LTACWCAAGQAGVCLCKTNKALLIGCYESPVSAAECLTTVESLVDYLVTMQM
jgi:hypothetical protein